MRINHRERLAEDQRKHAPPPDYDERILDLINESVKEKAEQRDLNQGDTNGRDTED